MITEGSQSDLEAYISKSWTGTAYRGLFASTSEMPNGDVVCDAVAWRQTIEYLLSLPTSRFYDVMALNKKITKIYRVAAIGLEGAGKSTTFKSLAEHAQVKHPFAVGTQGGTSFTQRLTTAQVGRFQLIDTKGLPAHD